MEDEGRRAGTCEAEATANIRGSMIDQLERRLVAFWGRAELQQTTKDSTPFPCSHSGLMRPAFLSLLMLARCFARAERMCSPYLLAE